MNVPSARRRPRSGSLTTVLRSRTSGGGVGAGPQHSQCLEAWVAHVPGLKVVCPATIPDAYALLRAAIKDPDPVIFVENKSLYAKKGEMLTPIASRLAAIRVAARLPSVACVYGASRIA